MAREAGRLGKGWASGEPTLGVMQCTRCVFGIMYLHCTMYVFNIMYLCTIIVEIIFLKIGKEVFAQ